MFDFDAMLALMLKALIDEDEVKQVLSEDGVIPKEGAILEKKRENLRSLVQKLGECQREHNMNEHGYNSTVLFACGHIYGEDAPACPQGTYRSIVDVGNCRHSDILVIHGLREALYQSMQQHVITLLTVSPLTRIRGSILKIRNAKLNGQLENASYHDLEQYVYFENQLKHRLYQEFRSLDARSHVIPSALVDKELEYVHWLSVFDEIASISKSKN